jgi:hypothetical protein
VSDVGRSESAARVGVIGSRGNNTASWTEALLGAGLAVVQLVRDPAALPPRTGVERRRLDLDRPTGFVEALDDLDVLGLATPVGPARSAGRSLSLRPRTRQGSGESSSCRCWAPTSGSRCRSLPGPRPW